MIILFTEIFYASENVLPALRLIFPNTTPSIFPLQPHLLSLPPLWFISRLAAVTILLLPCTAQLPLAQQEVITSPALRTELL